MRLPPEGAAALGSLGPRLPLCPSPMAPLCLVQGDPTSSPTSIPRLACVLTALSGSPGTSWAQVTLTWVSHCPPPPPSRLPRGSEVALISCSAGLTAASPGGPAALPDPSASSLSPPTLSCLRCLRDPQLRVCCSYGPGPASPGHPALGPTVCRVNPTKGREVVRELHAALFFLASSMAGG